MWTQNTVTNVRLTVNFLSLKSTIAFFNMSPWLLYTVMAHAKRMGICKHEHIISDLLSQIRRISAIGITLSLSKLKMIGPV